MAPAAAFATVLDEYLDNPPMSNPAAAGRSSIGVATRSLFWFEGASAVAAPSSGSVRRVNAGPGANRGDNVLGNTSNARPGNGRPGNAVSGSGRSGSARSYSARPGSGRPGSGRPVLEPLRLVKPAQAPAPRVARALSPAQRDALDQMIGLGARLDDTFTAQELRSEFRALARLYHPDRLQAVAGASAARSSSRFVALRRAYDILKKAA